MRAANLDLRLVSVGIFRLLHDVQLEAGLLEIAVEPIVDHLVGEGIDLDLRGHSLLLKIGLIGLLLLLATIGILEDGIEVSLQKTRPLADLRVEL